MKLISMTDFVLSEKGDNIKYAQFLRQPLTLDMFIGDEALFEFCADFPRDFYIDLNVYNIEDIVKFDLALTQKAIKQLGL